MKNLSLFMLFALGLTTFMSCDDTDDCNRIEAAAVVASEMVDTTTVNEVVDITVAFDVINGCGDYGGSTLELIGNTVTIEVDASYVGCICTQAIERREQTLNFRPTSTGTYFFEFIQEDAVTHRDTLVVQ